MPPSAYGLDGMFSPRLSRLLTERKVDVLVPLGALEQHGPHLPLSTDTLIVEAVARTVAERAGDLLVAPCLPVGCSDYHLGFSGTASISSGVVSDYLRSLILDFLRHGFRYAYLVSGHAGNLPAMEAVLKALPRGLRRRAAAYLDWPEQRDAMHQWAQRVLGLEPEKVGSHAGHFETSIVLYLAPQLVDMGAASAGFVGSLERALKLMREKGIGQVSPIGVVGDPCSASAEAGAGYFDLMVNLVIAFIRAHRSRQEAGG